MHPEWQRIVTQPLSVSGAKAAKALGRQELLQFASDGRPLIKHEEVACVGDPHQFALRQVPRQTLGILHDLKAIDPFDFAIGFVFRHGAVLSPTK